MMICLTKKQKRALEKIVQSGITKKFYLAGGTAISIKYNHRISEDFDFFIKNNKFNFQPFIQNLSDTRILTLSNNTLIFDFLGVKFSFFCYNYKLIEELYFHKELNINIASDKDIICMKAISIIQRGSKKDFYDLWFLMKNNKFDINHLINFCKEKYEDKFSEQLLLKSLIYFNDAEKEEYKDIEKNWNEIKNFFIRLVNKYIN